MDEDTIDFLKRNIGKTVISKQFDIAEWILGEVNGQFCHIVNKNIAYSYWVHFSTLALPVR